MAEGKGIEVALAICLQVDAAEDDQTFVVGLSAGLSDHGVGPSGARHLAHHREWLPRMQITIEHTDVIEGNIASRIKDFVVSPTVEDHELVAGVLDAEVDHGGVDAWAGWLTAIVLNLFDFKLKDRIVLGRASVVMVIARHNPSVRFVLRHCDPEVILGHTFVVHSAEDVESFDVRLLLIVLFSREQSFLTPHYPPLRFFGRLSVLSFVVISVVDSRQTVILTSTYLLHRLSVFLDLNRLIGSVLSIRLHLLSILCD